ncbi:hypothetical protein JWJ88_10430 [Paracoccus methylovorus]|jgi:hypothetical protein|uniref:Uncharacterized protein n=5 Tax=Paracoccus TaxID=265 RepID=A0A1W6CV41_9RHOB|nr:MULTISPECIES: hypothetical protein [Paracoccus]ARJ68714.1 hypothetical protein B0A89_02740 [Paracoccus contaminans]KGJ14316.1 hypothetical protein IX54_07730 [Paracoccus sanguinis]MBU3029722.1 hypothetical protein [Paracoccus marinaquae]QRZ12989.1 hypothetical protein JWJ88_10430 [Paracoccus methylovorus]CQR84738.1 putative membrane protein [Paracoccus aminovorans]
MLARFKSWLAIAAAAILFILGARRSGEKAGRANERLENLERTNDARQRMLDAASRRPHDRDALAERLRDGKF